MDNARGHKIAWSHHRVKSHMYHWVKSYMSHLNEDVKSINERDCNTPDLVSHRKWVKNWIDLQGSNGSTNINFSLSILSQRLRSNKVHKLISPSG